MTKPPKVWMRNLLLQEIAEQFWVRNDFGTKASRILRRIEWNEHDRRKKRKDATNP